MPRMARQISREMATLATMADADKVVLGLARMLKKMAAADAVAVYFVQADGSLSPCVSCAPLSRRTLFATPPFADSLASRLRRRRRLLLDGAERISPAWSPLLRRYSLVLLPMVCRGKGIGAVVMARRASAPPFTAEELEGAGDIVSYASLVVNNLRLFDDSLELALDMAQRIDVILALDEINKGISSSLSKKTVLDTAVRHVERMIGCPFVAVLEESRGELVVAAHINTGREVRPRYIPGGGPAEGSLLRQVMSGAQAS
ncbi:MAG TPA: GAF domain-containing protein, partial [Verrucomicrobiae bacterium]|nr:GAF domain-containing protein [Verrucomicrobiae bacterium]